jgi:hypothetical protein
VYEDLFFIHQNYKVIEYPPQNLRKENGGIRASMTGNNLKIKQVGLLGGDDAIMSNLFSMNYLK